MNIDVEDPVKLLAAVRRARQQCQTRVVQLSSCRICGADQEEFERTVSQLKALEHQLEEASRATV